MRFESYLLSEGRSKQVDTDTAISLIKKKCSKHYRKILSTTRPHIYRGVSGFSYDFGIVDPRSGAERKSANTSNHMTLLMDNLPSWKEYPKRSRSIVCSTNAHTANMYGVMYIIYPTDDCKIGIVPAADVWSGFYTSLGYGVEEFNDLLVDNKISDKSFAKLKSDLIRRYELDTIYEFKKQLLDGDYDSASQVIENIAISKTSAAGITCKTLHNFVIRHLNSYHKSGKGLNIIDWLNESLSPRANGFMLDKLSKRHKHNEVWIGNGPSFLIKNTQENITLLRKEGLYL